MARGACRADEQFVSFGEQGAQLTYGSYLRLPQLLDAQHLESDPPAHDELLFITIHQVYELWFKQLLHEAAAARDAMSDGRLWWAQHLLHRVHVIERVLVHQIDVLETMTPRTSWSSGSAWPRPAASSRCSSASWSSSPAPRTRPTSSGSAG